MIVRRLRRLSVLALPGLVAVPARAQEPLPPPLVVPLLPERAAPRIADDSTYRYPWRWGFFPALSDGTNDGPMLQMRVRGFQMAEYSDRIVNRQSFSAVAGGTFRGSALGLVRYQAPRFGPGLRLWTQAQVNREARFGYFGLGNATTYDPDAVTEAVPFPYRARRTRLDLRADVTARLTGPLSAALGVHGQLARFSALEGPSAFRTDFGERLDQDDAAARLALLVDTRDLEFDPHRGVLLEAGGELGSGNGGYERLYAILRGYTSLGPKTVLAARALGTRLSGSPTLDARFTLPAWEQPVDLLGGQFSHRGLQFGRLAGRSALLGNLEVRQEVKNIRGAVDLILVGFVDAGRVFEQESFRLTTDDLKVAAGVGAGLKLLRASVFTMNVARGPEGWRVSANNGWMF